VRQLDTGFAADKTHLGPSDHQLEHYLNAHTEPILGLSSSKVQINKSLSKDMKTLKILEMSYCRAELARRRQNAAIKI
jgi:hypothetical protein